jgi:hypothetical protein
MAKTQPKQQQEVQEDVPTAGIGASDGYSGGGSGSGLPDADTAMRCEPVTGGDVETDRKKIFESVGRDMPAKDDSASAKQSQASDVPAKDQEAPTGA